MNTLVNDAKQQDFLDILFEDRNKEYGAYQLRKKYAKNLSLAFLFAMGVFALAIGIPAILNLLKEEEAVEVKRKSTVVELTNLAEEEEKEEEKIIEEPPVLAELQFVAPDITAEEVKPEEQMIKQDEINPWANIGDNNIEGDSVFGIPEETTVIGGGENEGAPLMFAEEPPTFPGGEDALYKWLYAETRYPEYALENNIEGRVVVRFVVGKDGDISNIQIARSVPLFDDEVIRVVKNMPKWNAGKQNGRNVAVWFSLPVVFELK